MCAFVALSGMLEVMLDVSGFLLGLAYFFKLLFSANSEITVSSCYFTFEESGLKGSRLFLNLF